jgi:hypothetical protein
MLTLTVMVTIELVLFALGYIAAAHHLSRA